MNPARFNLVVQPVAVWVTVIGFGLFIILGVCVIGVNLLFGPILGTQFSLGAGVDILIITFVGISICYRQFYEFGDDSIRFRSGLFTLGKVQYSRITSVERSTGWTALSYTFHSMPGFALKKARGRLFVMPREEQAFLRALRDRASYLRPAIDALLEPDVKSEDWYPRS